jgi:SAM-dependent methyltransferase
VLLVGVLEWLGADYDFVVSRDYGRKGFLASPESSPAFLQLTALKEIRRVLRPRGLLFIAIENRFFYKHFWGSPDPHTAMPFSSLLPRPLANIYMRLLKKRDYTEYTYSYWGYNRILKKAGFGSADFYAVMPSYREPEVIIPLASSRLIRYFYQNYALKKLKGLKRLIPEAILRLNLMKYFVPSFFVLAGK